MRESGRNEIIEKLSSIPDLPTLPQVATRLQEEAASSRASAGTISEIIREDPAISIKVLKVANSPLYGLGRNVTDMRAAVRVLGFKEVCNIVLSMSTLKLFKGASHIDYKRFWNHSLSVAFATKAIVDFTGKGCRAIDSAKIADLFIAGLLHDIGILVMDQYMPEKYESVLKAMSSMGDVPIYGVEYECLGISHGEVGGLILRQWNIPAHITDAVAFHHKPEDLEAQRELTEIVHIADFICNNQGVDNGTGAHAESFSDSAWTNLDMSLEDINGIIKEVRMQAEKSPILMALV